MFFIELADGSIITGTESNWQEIAKIVEDKKSSISQLGLTDMLHFRESISGADAYYYFAEAEATLSNRIIDGQMRSVPQPPRVIAEEIAGFYGSESAAAIFEENIRQCDGSIAALESHLAELRATTITDDEVQKTVNMEISQKQGVLDQLRIRRKKLTEERKEVMAAGGFIISKRLQAYGSKFLVNISKDTPVPSKICEQDPAHWVGPVKPDFGKAGE